MVKMKEVGLSDLTVCWIWNGMKWNALVFEWNDIGISIEIDRE